MPLSAEKTLIGRSLKAGAFTFLLKDGAGKVIQEVTNQADGSVSFADRRFSLTGRFLYTIQEKPGSSPDIAYDPTSYRAIIDVSASGGVLQAAVSWERDGTPYAGPIRFQNSAKAPQTGDKALWLPLILLTAALSLGAAAFIIKRRKER